ncbi:Pectinesterase inhibitor domain [Arabidopsis thaliana x Arabidopsis arenosa]|uniref:Pectinesterase inhibitor domain n=1 Tax=Arabidopsis thaliana x Arabidopsis arenosa TaxID=1240361 RepID=A0A8T2ASI9_9BRAS|nr:Pectinesterase inhibitor domain [Arabidopsis thaliana x Arabidopsis arenosa]
MAAYQMNRVFVSSLMLFVMIGSLKAQVADLEAICGKAKNQSFCTSYMKSNPKTSGADLQTLAKITFGSAQTSASEGFKKIQSLVKTATNPTMKKAYTSCVQHYKSAISSLNDAKQSLASGDGKGLNIKVSAAMEGPSTCEQDMANFKVDPSAVKNSGDFQNICGIVLVISNMM